MIYPQFPQTGETIGICAPSAGVGHKLDSFDESLSAIASLGYNIKETASVRVDSLRPASGKVRAEEFHALMSDNDVRSIIAATGGEYDYEVLPYLNKNIISSNPKWFCGYSDPTNIMYYMTTALDIATIYGFNAGSFDWSPLHEYQKNALAVLSGNIVTQHSYELWDSNKDWSEVKLDTPVRWDLYVPGQAAACVDEFEVTGRIIGGCTDVIAKLIGTPFDGTASFTERYADDGFIWYFDTFEMNANALYLTMLQMKLAGFFRNAKAIIFGRVMLPAGSTEEEFVDNLRLAFDDIPFIWGADIGHTKPAMTMINGAIGHLRCRDGAAVIEQELI